MSWFEDLSFGEVGEAAVCRYLDTLIQEGTIQDYYRTPHTYYRENNLPYETDYVIVNNHGKITMLEVKAMKGIGFNGKPYTTFAAEDWADDNGTKRPGWFRTAEAFEENVDVKTMICFFNLADNTIYFHNSKKLLDPVRYYAGFSRRSSVVSKDNRGSFVTFSLDYYASYVFSACLDQITE